MARASKASAASKKKATTKKAAATKASSGGASKEATGAAKAAPTKAAATKGASSAKSPAKKAAAKGGRAGKSTHFDSKFLERMRKLLHVERDTYERQARQLRAEADSLVMDMDPGDVQFDEESGEGDTIAVERGRDLALAAKAMEMIEEIDHALTKFDLGTYGICEVSGEPIPEERLEAIPWAREKVEYKVGGFGRR
ncbi:MAG TPA: TraR/DksA C4-type zinc finger protein [Acidimicrobiales bacterium]